MEQLIRDVGYGLRGLWRDRTFAFTTVTTLAVALALVTVVFAIFNAYVLRPYAVRDPGTSRAFAAALAGILSTPTVPEEKR